MSVSLINHCTTDMLSSAVSTSINGCKRELGGRVLENKAQLNNFLAGIESKAFRIAHISTGNRDDALEIVQDAMLRLVQNYANRSESEWPPLFYRILNNRITDHYRKNAVKQRLFGWLGFYNDETGEIENNPDLATDHSEKGPEARLELQKTTMRATDAIQQLSPRQQQAFMLRAWEGLSVEETAFAMKCSEGSVKTHYSRAVHSLKAIMAEMGQVANDVTHQG